MQYRYFAGLNANALNESDQRRMGFNLDEIMISCTYNLEACNSSEFEWYYDTLYGYKRHKVDINQTRLVLYAFFFKDRVTSSIRVETQMGKKYPTK